MGLYLCVFDNDDEIEGVEVGSYADFARFRSTITELLEEGKTGRQYPTLILHSDCDGEWSPADCQKLKRELDDIADRCRQLPPIAFQAEWQQQVSRSLGLRPSALYDSFIDVDGEPLIERLQQLCDVAVEHDQPILFQ